MIEPRLGEGGQNCHGRLPGRSACANVQTGIGQANRRELHTKVFSFQNKEGHEARNLMPLEEWQVVHYYPSYFVKL